MTQNVRISGGPGWRRLLATLPGGGAALLPIGACPACWPVYAGLLSSLGLGFLLDGTWMFVVMTVLLGLSLFALAYRARYRRGYGPVAIGALAVAVILVSKFILASNALVYGGVAGLITASIWNAWPRRSVNTGSCPKCAGQDPVS